MKKYKLLFITLILISINSYAQQWKRFRYEAIVGIGGTNFLGELGGANRQGTNFVRDLEISMTRPLINVALRYQINQQFSFKPSLTYGLLRGDDKTTKEMYRNYRNLSFRSPILEFSTQLEYWPIKEQFKGSRYSLKRKKSLQAFGKVNSVQIYPYFFAGVSVFYFNPKTKYNGKWYALQPLGTEGQGLLPTRKKYKRVQMSIPYGIGFKYPITRRMMIGLEYGVRKTFTDYIDDVSTTYYDQKLLTQGRGTIASRLADRSDPNNPDVDLYSKTHPNWTDANQQRGDSRDKDSYMFLIVNLIYKLNTSVRGIPKF